MLQALFGGGLNYFFQKFQTLGYRNGCWTFGEGK
jgi:hypothetical protein